MTGSKQCGRLRLALQKSGRLTERSLDLLGRCGLKYNRGKDELMAYGENMPLDLLFVRDDDIPDLVEQDVCDLGIVGLNVVEEKRLAAEHDGYKLGLEKLLELDYGHCRLAVAAPDAEGYEGTCSLAGRRIATTYPHTLEHWLGEQSVSAEIVHLSGAVEIAPRIGRADFVCDLVSTGSTLKANRLREVATVMKSQVVLIRTPYEVGPEKERWMHRLLLRILGVQQVRESKYVLLHAPRTALKEIRRLLPGSEAPTIVPLDGEEDRVAVHAVCHENVFWETLEALKAAGAASLLVLPVEKILA